MFLTIIVVGGIMGCSNFPETLPYEKSTISNEIATKAYSTDSPSSPLDSRPLKSICQRDIFPIKCLADFFDKCPKEPHGSFEVVCRRSQKGIHGISEVRFLVEQQKKPDPLRLFCSSFLQDFLRLSPPLQFQEVYYSYY